MQMKLDFDDLIIDLEARLSKNRLERSLLIEETFALWYVLVEGVPRDEFEEKNIQNFLIRNVRVYQSSFNEDADFCFIIGWMTNIAFWYFEPLLKEQDGLRLLKEAYKRDPGNSLFKWAIRKELRLGELDIVSLRMDIELRYDQLYNYGSLLKEYFLDIINAPQI